MSKRDSVDTPDSPLSDVQSEVFDDDTRAHSTLSSPGPDETPARPAKRQRLSRAKRKPPAAGSKQALAAATSYTTASDVPEEGGVPLPEIASDEDISSDTDGSVPASPILDSVMGALGQNGSVFNSNFIMDDDGDGFGERDQASLCKWDGCDAGELGNMDLLVQHIHENHIYARVKKYSCEWMDCPRKGTTHASGYALRAHIRGHTREKPFYCSLPECDRSFTRSDALAKHMRTVHETEALRPSDPVPRNHSSNPQNKSQRLRITFNKLSAGGEHADSSPISMSSRAFSNSHHPSPPPSIADWEQGNVTWSRDDKSGEWVAHFPPNMHFTDKELALPPAKLACLITKQIEWAIEAGQELQAEAEQLAKLRQWEWSAQELVFRDYAELEEQAALLLEQEDKELIQKLAEEQAREQTHEAELPEKLLLPTLAAPRPPPSRRRRPDAQPTTTTTTTTAELATIEEATATPAAETKVKKPAAPRVRKPASGGRQRAAAKAKAAAAAAAAEATAAASESVVHNVKDGDGGGSGLGLGDFTAFGGIPPYPYADEVTNTL